MLKHIFALAALSLTLATPAIAQNAGHISKAKAGQSCAGCNLFQADMAYRDISGTNLSESRLRQSDLSLTTLEGVNLSGSDLSIANLFGARLNRCNLSGADLKSAAAVGTYFGSSNLSGTDLKGANLSGADLSRASGLTQSQLNKACGDATTRLPKGLRIPRCR
ncbi:MAG: pentapeptide repeat-containing protein [Pseudomonadota bacterium]